MSPRVINAASYAHHASKFQRQSKKAKKQKDLMRIAAKFIKEATFDSDEETFIKE